MKTLFLIPARAGSKGIIKKNIREIAGKPLVIHSLEFARQFAQDSDICISTDDADIVKVAGDFDYSVPFIRPHHLASDTSSMRDVILHAIDFYKKRRINYDRIVLLQPTSPFRQKVHLDMAFDIYTSDIDMVVSVTETKANPYYVLFEENGDGLLEKSKIGTFTTRQECPKVWQLNGAIYVITVNSIEKTAFSEFKKIRKVEMENIYSIDLDNEIDWKLALLLNDEYRILS